MVTTHRSCSDHYNQRVVGYKHTKADILEEALRAATDDGLSQLTFGRLAKRLGISDRTVVYYFPSKDDLIGEVILAMGVQLQATLAEAFATPAKDHLEIVALTSQMLATDDVDPIFALFFEANGLAVAGREPYVSLVPSLVTMWIDWVAEFIDGGPDDRRAEAEAAIAVIDGLLLVRQLAGADAAERAAGRIGVT